MCSAMLRYVLCRAAFRYATLCYVIVNHALYFATTQPRCVCSARGGSVTASCVQWLVPEDHTYLSTYLPTYLSTYLPIYLSTYLPIYLPFYLSTYLPIYLHAYIHTYIFTRIFMYTCTHVHMYTCTHVHVSHKLFIPSLGY